MKKVVFWLIIVVIVGGGIWYVTRKPVVPVDATVTTYKNSNVGLTFTYPKILTASTTGNLVTLHHEIPFIPHHDYCDFRDEGTSTVNNLVDLDIKFHVVNKNMVDTMKAESPYMPQENFVNGEVVASPGFIDPYAVGDLKGFSIYEGAEGCGHTIYYLSVTSNKTLVVENHQITVFSGALMQETESAARNAPGVILPETSKQIFESILKNIKVQ